jgi:hypothetical protein
VLDITWTREAGDGVQRSWTDSVACAANLVFAGLGDWRLPSARVSQGAGPTMLLYICTGGGADELACRDDEMGYMYYYNLNGTAGDDKSNDQLAVGGQCLDIQESCWSGTRTDDDAAWFFRFGERLIEEVSDETISHRCARSFRISIVLIAIGSDRAAGAGRLCAVAGHHRSALSCDKSATEIGAGGLNARSRLRARAVHLRCGIALWPFTAANKLETQRPWRASPRPDQ